MLVKNLAKLLIDVGRLFGISVTNSTILVKVIVVLLNMPVFLVLDAFLRCKQIVHWQQMRVLIWIHLHAHSVKLALLFNQFRLHEEVVDWESFLERFLLNVKGVYEGLFAHATSHILTKERLNKLLLSVTIGTSSWLGDCLASVIQLWHINVCTQDSGHSSIKLREIVGVPILETLLGCA